MKTLEIGSIHVDDITVPARLRKVDENWVTVIAETMKSKGQLQPILLEQKGDKLLLVAGRHRLAAAKRNGQASLEARIVEMEDEDEAKELEAVENIARSELTALDKALHLGTLRDIYQRRNPENRRGGDHKSKKFNEKSIVQNLHGNGPGVAPILHFDGLVAENIKMSRRSVYNFLSLYDRLDPAVVARIQGTALADHFTELQALSREDKANQTAILDLVTGPEPKAASIAQAASIHHNDIDTSTPDERDFARFVKLWARSSKKLRKQIAAHIAKGDV